MVLLGLWGFVPYELPPGSLYYPARGIWFGINEHWRVERVSISRPRLNNKRLGPPKGARRPTADEILPGVGCGGVMLGDTERAVLGAPGPPLEPGVARVVTLPSGDVDVWFGKNGASFIETTRKSATTPEGIGVGSRVSAVLRAYGPTWADHARAYGTPEEEARYEKERRYHIGVGRLRKACIVAFVAIIASLVSCVALGASSGGPCWPAFVLAHFLLWSLVQMAVFAKYPLFLGIGYPDEPSVTLDSIVRMWFRIPLLGMVLFATVIGFFVGARFVASLVRHSRLAVYAGGVVGAALVGSFAGQLVLRLADVLGAVPEYLTQAERWERLLAGATMPSIVAVGCFLLVASQRKPWWRTVRMALGLEGRQDTPSGAEG